MMEIDFSKITAYQPAFTNVPIRIEELTVTLTDEEYQLLRRSALTELYGSDDGAALRDIVFSWWGERFISAS